MKIVLSALAIVLFSLTAADAALISCPSATGVVSLGDPSGLTFTCGSLTFGNFQVASTGGDAIGTVDINSASYDSVTGTVSLNLNPNLQSSQTEALMFQVSGGVTRLDLALGGNDAQVTERACSSPIPTSGPGAFLCPTGSQLGSVSDFSNDPNAPVFSGNFTNTSPVYIFKQIQTGPGGIGPGELSVLNQRFEVSAIPEPVSLVLLGSGLLGLGLLRRRTHKS